MQSDPSPAKHDDSTEAPVRAAVRRVRDSISLPALVATVLWAGNATAISIALRNFSSLALTEVRMAGAIPLLLALMVLTRRGLRLPRGRNLALLVFAGGAYGTSVFSLTIGLHYTTAVNATLLFSTSPLMALLIAAVLGHERLSARRIVGAAVALVGVALIVFRHGVTLGAGELPGDLLILTAALASAILAIVQVFLFAELGVLGSTTLVVAIGGILTLPFTWAELVRQDWAVSSLASWGGLIYSVVLAVVVPMLLWNMALRAIGPRRTIIYMYLQPIFGAAIAVLILSEPIVLAHGVGTALVLSGLALSRRGARSDAQGQGGPSTGRPRPDVVPEAKVGYHSGNRGTCQSWEDRPCP